MSGQTTDPTTNWRTWLENNSAYQPSLMLLSCATAEAKRVRKVSLNACQILVLMAVGRVGCHDRLDRCS